jgi:hypothetical protein
MSPRDRVRFLLGVIGPALWTAAAMAPFLWLGGRVPEPMASHWPLSGPPDGSLPRAVVLAIHMAMAVGPALGAFGVTRRVPAASGGVAPVVAVSTGVGVLGAGLAAITIRANLDASHWRDAQPLSLVALGAVLCAAAVAAAAAHRLGRRLERPAEGRGAIRLASIGLARGERASWSGGAANPPALAVGTVCLVGGFAALPLGALVSGVAVAVGLAVLLFASVQVRVDHTGITISLGPVGRPRFRVPLARIKEARPVDVSPLHRGGWGYRGSMTLFGRAAVIIRGGRGIEVQRMDGALLVVTVDDAETAAGLLNDLVRREAEG